MTLRNMAIWGVILLLLVGLWSMVRPGANAPSGEESYSQLLQNIEAGHVKSAMLKAQSVDVVQTDGKHTVVTPADQGDLIKDMHEHNVDISVTPAGGSLLLTILLNFLPFIAIGVLYFFAMRQMQGGARGAMGFGKSKARLLTENKNRVTFDDVAGVDEAKEELTEIVDFLKDPAKFQKPGRQDPEGRAAGRPAGHRQDPARPRRRRRGGRAVLLHLGLRLR